MANNRCGSEQMVLSFRCELRHRSHRPEKIPDIVSVSVVPPIRIGVIEAATCDLAILGGKVGGVIQRAKSILARLSIMGTFIIERIDSSPPRRVAGQAGARTTSDVVRRRALLVDGPCAEIRTSPEALFHPIEQMAGVA